MAEEPEEREERERGEHHGERHPHETPKTGDKAKEKKRQHLLIVIGIAGLVLTYIIYSKSKATAASSSAPAPNASTTTSPDTVSSPSGDGATDTYAENEANQITSALQGFQSYLASLSQNEVGAGTTGSGSGTGSDGGGGTGSQGTGNSGGSGSGTGSVGGTTPPGSVYNLISTDVANTVAADLMAGIPVYYQAAAGDAYLPVTVSGGVGSGGGWLAGGQPIGSISGGNASGPPGAPSGYYTET